MADAGAQRSCCIKNQWRLRNAEKTLETLEDIYQKSEGEIRELQTLQALTNDQQATDDDNDPDQRATYWMDQYYDLDYDSSEEKNKTSLAVSDTQKKRNIYTSFNHSGFLKTDEEINKMVMFPETDIRRKIKLYSSDSEDNSE
ncbi:uncharacterized protein LOC111269849 isoform X2 [Varroa jacobsoni]|uniref:Uncharacterized protein n=1 Tax=Varroa destructor TaxID=109461 RepID=A0A7M7MGA0_VARDE|nr:uncharacterized protein LOC111249693 isoform X2 [Varroa destructor]XP_022705457.1 uncharacterized protein LOC111269849 isoform X2 [Varroa jacobsoni]